MPAITDLEAEKKQLLQTIETYQQQLQQNLETKEQLLLTKEKKHHIEQEHKAQTMQHIQQEQLLLGRLQLQKQTVDVKIKELQKQVQHHEQEQELIDQKLQSLHKEQPKKINNKQLTAQEQQFEKRKNTYQYFVTFGNVLQKERANLDQKKRFTHDNNNPSCPLCEQNLSASRRRFLKKKFAKQERFLQHRLNRLHTIIPNLKKLLVAQHHHITTLKDQSEKKLAHERTISELQKEKQKIEVYHQQLNGQLTEQINAQKELTKQYAQEQALLTKKQARSDSLEKNKKYQQQVEKINNLQATLAATTYQADHHKKIQKRGGY